MEVGVGSQLLVVVTFMSSDDHSILRFVVIDLLEGSKQRKIV
jgi:hypothetical protein